MVKAKVFFIVSSITLLLVAGATAQVNPVYQRMLKNGWKYPFENGFRKLTPPEVDSEFCRSMGYDDSTVANLKRIGVDVAGRWKRHVVWDKKAWAALSDCIVVGTVSKVEHPFPRSFWFHTVAYVQVDQFLRNDYGLPKEEVPVLEISGPTGRPGEQIDLIGEDTLRIGEHVLLFLSASSLILFAADNNMHDLYNYLINDSTISFQMLAKYDIKSGEVLTNTKKESLRTVTDSISSIVNVINRSAPLNR